MANEKESKIEGEGSYSAARDYDKAVKGFVKREGGRITDLAKDAEEAMDSPEAEELKQAEAKGAAPARD